MKKNLIPIALATLIATSCGSETAETANDPSTPDMVSEPSPAPEAQPEPADPATLILGNWTQTGKKCDDAGLNCETEGLASNLDISANGVALFGAFQWDYTLKPDTIVFQMGEKATSYRILALNDTLLLLKTETDVRSDVLRYQR